MPWELLTVDISTACLSAFSKVKEGQSAHMQGAWKCKRINNVLKSRDISLSTGAHVVEAMVFPAVRYSCDSQTVNRRSAEEWIPLSCGAGGDSWESLGWQGDQASQSQRKSTLNTQWKEWCWSWSSSILVTWFEQPTHWKSPWCWKRLRAGEESVRGWDGWMASLMQWTWT